MLSDCIDMHKFKMMGTHLEAELFLSVSAELRGMKRKEQMALGSVQNFMCQVVKCLHNYHATVSSLIPY